MISWVTNRVNGLASWVVRRRADLPTPLRRAIDSLAGRGSWTSRLMLRASGQRVPDPIGVPAQPVRLYIGPTNYAGQAFEWARAVERTFPTVGVRNASFALVDDFAFPADYRVPLIVYQASAAWQTAQLASIENYTHVLIESFTPLLGNHWEGSLVDEVRSLRQRGLNVAFMCHGTDVRLPSHHRELNRWSPFVDNERTRALQKTAARNHDILEEVGGTAFVSTPDLLLDVPSGVWSPVVVDAARWAAAATPILGNSRPRVVHIPSAGPVKGSDLIVESMEKLDRAGIIEFQAVAGVPSTEMPALYGAADIVLDQFRIGSYGVAACEAMAAGRIVVSHVTDTTRSSVRALTGLELPIVEADAATLPGVVSDIAANPGAYREIGESGIEFVQRVHNGAYSARILDEHLHLSRNA